MITTCKDISDFLMEYVDGALPLGQRVQFEAHLVLCRSCRNYLDSYRKTIELTKKTGVEDELPPVPEDLIKAILRSREGKGPPSGGA